MEILRNNLNSFIKEEEGIGVVEIILILVIIIGLVILFKDKITSVVTKTLNKIVEDSNSIIE